MFFLDIGQAPITQHLAIAGGQSQRLQLTTNAAQGTKLAEAAPERGENCALECQTLITNAHGFTEGNTAGDRFGQGVPTAIFGRPLFGRNVRLIVSRAW